MTASILPANLADLERDLDAALARIELIDIPTADLWDPWRCPLDVLPYLAWSVSVDMWRSTWAEDTKRRVVAASLRLHRVKGTRPAVAQALESLGVTATIQEWFEAEPSRPPGTFAISLSTGFESQEHYEQVIGGVAAAKNTRSHLEVLSQARRIEGALQLAAIVQGANRSRISFDPPTAAVQPINQTLAAVVCAASVLRVGLFVDALVAPLATVAAMYVQSARIVTIGASPDG